MDIIVNFETIMLLVILGLCIYLINGNKTSPKPLNKVKSRRALSSHSSILSLPKFSDFTYRSKKVIRICITGGPCAGKTSALAMLSFRLPELGYKVFSVPEAATLLQEGGANIALSSFTEMDQVSFQMRLIKLQMRLEDIYTNLAEKCKENCIVVCDRGVMDGAAYVPGDSWQVLLDQMGLTKVHLRDCRYDFVIHLVSAAQGAEEHYTDKSNFSRYESIEEARIRDKNLQNAWMGHPKLHIIDNDRVQSFDDKLQKCIEIVCSELGLPSSMSYSYKFLVNAKSTSIPEHLHTQKLQVEETFLLNEHDATERVQRRGHSNSYTYLYSKKMIKPDGSRTSKSNLITSRDYLSYLSKKDENRKTIKRILQCLIWGDDYMVLDTFLNVKKGLTILRIDTKKTKDELSIPPFISIVRDVSSDQGYSSHKLAKKDWYIAESDKEIIDE